MRSWETTSGEKRNVLEVRASRIQFLGKAPLPEEPVELKEESLEALLNEDAPNNSTSASTEKDSNSKEVPF